MLSSDNDEVLMWRQSKRRRKMHEIHPSITKLIQHSANACAKKLKSTSYTVQKLLLNEPR
jgi:hypothetical protein